MTETFFIYKLYEVEQSDGVGENGREKIVREAE